MFNWDKLRAFLGMCVHEWEDHTRITIVDDLNFPTGTKMVQRCTKCMKFRRLKM